MDFRDAAATSGRAQALAAALDDADRFVQRGREAEAAEAAAAGCHPVPPGARRMRACLS